jgi:hypothetical protein
LWIKNSVPATHDNDILWRKNRVPLTDKSCFFFVGLKLSHAVEDVPDVPARHMQMPCTKPIMGSCSPTTADSRRWGAAGGGSSFPRFSKSWSPQNLKKRHGIGEGLYGHYPKWCRDFTSWWLIACNPCRLMGRLWWIFTLIPEMRGTFTGNHHFHTGNHHFHG